MLFCKIQDSLGYKNRMISSGERWEGGDCLRDIVYFCVIVCVMRCGLFYRNAWSLIGQLQQECIC